MRAAGAPVLWARIRSRSSASIQHTSRSGASWFATSVFVRVTKRAAISATVAASNSSRSYSRLQARAPPDRLAVRVSSKRAGICSAGSDATLSAGSRSGASSKSCRTHMTCTNGACVLPRPTPSVSITCSNGTWALAKAPSATRLACWRREEKFPASSICIRNANVLAKNPIRPSSSGRSRPTEAVPMQRSVWPVTRASRSAQMEYRVMNSVAPSRRAAWSRAAAKFASIVKRQLPPRWRFAAERGRSRGRSRTGDTPSRWSRQ